MQSFSDRFQVLCAFLGLFHLRCFVDFQVKKDQLGVTNEANRKVWMKSDISKSQGWISSHRNANFNLLKLFFEKTVAWPFLL